MPEYKAVREFDKSGLILKAGDSIELEPEDAMDLPVVPAGEYVESVPEDKPKAEKIPAKKPMAKKPAVKKTAKE